MATLNSETKPKKLYRGVCIDYNLLKSFIFDGVDLVPPNPPLIDEKGRKTVLDGNEYGVYMSDNPTMVEQVYGNVHHTKVNLNPRDDYAIRVGLPQVGVVYEINTDGLSVRKPFIADYLKGHYNNGMSGDEWIADRVSKNNYFIKRVVIGSDILHDKETIFDDSENDYELINYIKDDALEIIEERKKHLEDLVGEIKKYSIREVASSGRLDYVDIFREIFGNDGVKYINKEDIDINTAMGAIKYLMAITYEKNKDSKIDFNAFYYLELLKYKISKLIEKGSMGNTYYELISYLTNENNKSHKSLLVEFINSLSKRIVQDKNNLKKYQQELEEYEGYIEEELFNDYSFMRLLYKKYKQNPYSFYDKEDDALEMEFETLQRLYKGLPDKVEDDYIDEEDKIEGRMM